MGGKFKEEEDTKVVIEFVDATSTDTGRSKMEGNNNRLTGVTRNKEEMHDSFAGGSVPQGLWFSREPFDKLRTTLFVPLGRPGRKFFPLSFLSYVINSFIVNRIRRTLYFI